MSQVGLIPPPETMRLSPCLLHIARNVCPGEARVRSWYPRVISEQCQHDSHRFQSRFGLIQMLTALVSCSGDNVGEKSGLLTQLTNEQDQKKIIDSCIEVIVRLFTIAARSSSSIDNVLSSIVGS